MSELTFKQLSITNKLRCEDAFHNINDWSPSDWGVAMAGECGEACNVIKKLKRLQDGYQLTNISSEDTLKQALSYELADIIIYADLLAQRLNINLGNVVIEKFNIVSDRVNSRIKL